MLDSVMETPFGSPLAWPLVAAGAAIRDFTSLAVVVLLMFGTAALAADKPPFLNAMPCVAEVCIGDDARNLGDIPWETALNPANDVPLSRSRLSDEALASLGDVLEGDDDAVRKLAPYWYLHRLDKVALDALGKIRALCANVNISDRMTGTYRSKQGYLTESVSNRCPPKRVCDSRWHRLFNSWSPLWPAPSSRPWPTTSRHDTPAWLPFQDPRRPADGSFCTPRAAHNSSCWPRSESHSSARSAIPTGPSAMVATVESTVLSPGCAGSASPRQPGV